MGRIVRERGSVGRRIWRRRVRKRSGTEQDHDDADDDFAPPPAEPMPEIAEPPPPAKKRGLFDAVLALLGAGGAAARPDPPYLVVDPVRDVLAVPRGAARLDAFERALVEVEPGSRAQKDLALAFLRELQALADHAGVDLSLLEGRVEACAQALIAVGEEERAGTLFLKVGRRHQAAELFVAAGAVDELEEAHAHIRFEEGGPRHEARMAFERFEALFLVGMREQALTSLERACALWRDNTVYAEILHGFRERLGPPRQLLLARTSSSSSASSSAARELWLHAALPIVIGRGEEAAVRLESPLLSRAHLRIEQGASGPVVVDLESRGGTHINGAPLVGKAPLPLPAEIDMAGVVVHVEVRGATLELWAKLTPEHRVIVPLVSAGGAPIEVDQLRLRFDAAGRAVLEPPALLGGEALRRPTLLLSGDRIAGADAAQRNDLAERSGASERSGANSSTNRARGGSVHEFVVGTRR